MAELPSNSLSSSVGNELVKAQQQLNIKNKFDAVISVIHLVFKQLGFECVGIGDVDDENAVKSIIPNNWNQSNDTWTLRYRHGKSTSRFTLKALKMDNILFVHIKASDSDKIHNVEINPSKFVTETNDFSSNIVSKFSDLNALVELIKNQIIGKVIPAGSNNNNNNNNNNNERENPYFVDDPLRVGPPRRPMMRNPDDDGFGYNPAPFGIGSGDLYPSMPGIPGMGGPGGNLIGPGSFQPYTPPTFGPNQGGGNGRGRYPPGVPPPGARFDPYTPFDPRGRRGFDPDPDHETPPHHDDFYS